MRLRTSVAASFAGQFIQVALRLLVVPIYIRLMGIEAYGLVSIYIVFLAVIQLLNFGLNSTLSREIARMRGGAINSATVRSLLRRLALILFAIAFVFALAGNVAAHAIAARWLHIVALPLDQTVLCIRAMLIAAAFGFCANLYKAALLGMEQQVVLNGLNTTFATLRSVGAIAVLVWVSATPLAFCYFQAATSIVEVCAAAAAVYRFLPPAEGNAQRLLEDGRRLRRFAGGLAITDTIWAGLLQLDRIVLSASVPLSHFGYFTIGTTAAYGISLLSSPILQAFQPRFALLAAGGQKEQLTNLYYKVTYGMTALAFSAASVLIMFPYNVIFAWTGNSSVAEGAVHFLPLYAAGNALVAVMSLPFLLQFALGAIRLHVIGNIAFAIVYAPLTIWLGSHYGAEGTGSAWLATNALYFCAVVPLVHRKLLPGGHLRWLTRCVLPAAAIPIAIAFVAARLPAIGGSRWSLAAVLCIVGFMGFVVSTLGSQAYRSDLLALIRARGRG